MTIISQTQRYIPHELNTKYYSVKLYRNCYLVSFVCRRYKIFKASLMRWNKRFDGSKLPSYVEIQDTECHLDSYLTLMYDKKCELFKKKIVKQLIILWIDMSKL